MVSPNHVAKETDRDHRVDDDFGAEERLAHAGDQHMRDDSHSGKNGYVDFGMAEKPEEVLPKQRRAAGMILEAVADDETRRDEKARPGHAVENQKQARGKQHGECEQADAGRDEPGPSAYRHAHQGHALGTQVKRGGNEIERTEQLSDAEEPNGNGPQILSPAKSGTRVTPNGAERSIGGPSGDRGAVWNEEREYEDNKSGRGGPEGHHVETRKGHVFGADLDRQEVVAEPGEGRVGQHKENHERAVHGEEREIVFRSDDAARSAVLGDQVEPNNLCVRPDEMKAHEPRQNHAREDGNQSEPVILLADHFMVE